MAHNKGFQPGVSGNPGGRTKKDIELEAHARLYAKYAIDVAAKILMNTEAPNVERLNAAKLILERGHGKPKEHITVKHERPISEWAEADLDNAIAELRDIARKAPSSSVTPKPH